MFKNVNIVGVGSYHPQTKVDNQYFINHFKSYQLEEHAEALMNKLGREIRTIAEEGETSISMAVDVAREAIKHSGLTSDDIDMIISVSDTPEYLSPCCALLIKHKLEAKNAHGVFDMNSNCIGMLTAMDGAAAIILEKTEEAEERGMLGSRMFTDDSYYWSITMPVCGISNIANEEINNEDKKMLWKPFDFSFLSDKWTELITNLLLDYGYGPDNVSHYFMSQFSKTDLDHTMASLGTDMKDCIYIGNKYGYTGCTSPIMALDDKLKSHKFKKDEIIVFCSVASGYSMTALLYEW